MREPRATRKWAGPIGVAALAALTVFAIPGPAAAQQLERGALDAARARWDATNGSDYVYGYRKACDCYRDLPPLTVVAVAAGEIERVHHVHDDSEREVPAREGSLDLYWTIDDLFAKLETALARDAEVRAEFDARYGYPTTLFVDYDTEFDGDETDIVVERFEFE